MGVDNAEVLRRGQDAYNRGELEETLESIDPNVIWEENDALFGFIGLDAVYEGHDGFRRWWEVTREPWTTIEIVSNEITPAAEDRLVASETLRGTGAGSGIEVEVPFSSVYDFRDGKILRRRIYGEHQDALEAAGQSG